MTTPQDISQAGKRAYENGQYAQAAALFLQARDAWKDNNAPLEAAEAANNASVSLLQAGEAQAALDVVQGTAAVFLRAGDLKRAGMAWGNAAAALEALERLDEALDAYRQSADLLKQAGETDLRLHVMQAISALQLRSGRQLEALASMQAGLDGVEKLSPKQRLLRRLLQIPLDWLNRRFS